MARHRFDEPRIFRRVAELLRRRPTALFRPFSESTKVLSGQSRSWSFLRSTTSPDAQEGLAIAGTAFREV